MKKTAWLETFQETQQYLLEDAFLLDALSMYAANGGYLMRHAPSGTCCAVLQRLSDYLSQHVTDLSRLAEQLDRR